MTLVFKAISDEFVVLKQNRKLWAYLSILDVKNRFRRSRLGVLWLVLQQLIFSIGAGTVWTYVFGLEPAEFIPFLTLGFALWGFISAALMEGCITLITAHIYIKQLPVSQSIFIARTLFTHLIYLLIGLGTALAISLYFGRLSFIGLLYSLPGILILIGYGYGAIGALSYLGLRYRDIQHGLASTLNVLFLVTPVIYPAEILIKKGLAFAIYGNPFSSLIEVVRYPMLNGEFAHLNHYLTSLAFIFVLSSLRLFFGLRWGRYVAFWS